MLHARNQISSRPSYKRRRRVPTAWNEIHFSQVVVTWIAIRAAGRLGLESIGRPREGSTVLVLYIRRSMLPRALLAPLLIVILAQISARASLQDQPGTPSEETVEPGRRTRNNCRRQRRNSCRHDRKSHRSGNAASHAGGRFKRTRWNISGRGQLVVPFFKQELAQLDAELPRLRSHLAPSSPPPSGGARRRRSN